ncbi:MAG TPA: sigma-70 family RNA polymerase sigma factor [Pyrinomonadaceae bacterium]|jgi:RNA polymerase sigma-70 factor (ECF subfamily)
MNFEEAFLPHLNAAYNLARWLTRNPDDAQDIVQEAYLRAFRFFGGFHGSDGRSWFLTIVRNISYTWLKQNKSRELVTAFDDNLYLNESAAPDPETSQVLKSESEMVLAAVDQLPLEFREVIVLRELEELSYKEISELLNIPIGTVMSRLARARKRLQKSLSKQELLSTPTPMHLSGCTQQSGYVS